MTNTPFSPYGRKAKSGDIEGASKWQPLGNDVERFESAPPKGVRLSASAWRALNDINSAIDQAEVRHYGGHRHYGKPWRPAHLRAA